MISGDTVSIEDLYKPNSALSFMVDFGEFHPAFLDAGPPVILECNKEHMELIHDVYGG